MSVHISSEKLLRTLVPIIEPALLSGDPLYRRGGYMCLALISEGCSEAFKRNNLEKMLSISIKRGVVDKDPGVRSVAFFALGQFSEYMQPQISAFAIQILPVLLDFLNSLVLEKALDQSEGPCYMTYDRMFYALEVYCENLEDKIVQYLPVLMERLLGCMDPRNIVKIRQLALSSISAVATASKENFLPYFPTIMDALKQCLVYECSESLNPLRIQAIDTLSSISRTVGKENFMHLAQDTTQFTLTMLEQGPDDPDMRRAIYSLIGGLAIVVTENMATVLPKIMERILQTVATTEQDCRTENEQDGDVEDDDKDDSDDYELQVQNDYLFEKAEAIITLKESAVNSYKSFSPYLTRSLEAVYKNIDHGQEVIRKASVDALCAFVIALDNVLDTEGVLRACAILMPKFSKLIQTDKEPCVVRNLLYELDDLIRAVKSAAFATPEQAEIVVGAIAGVLQNNTACQDSEHSGDGDAGEVDNEESECNEVLLESACNLVATIGQALELVYNAEDKSFGSFSVILQALSNAIANEKDASVLDNICGALARLIINNFNLVPLANVLPVFISVLPIRTDLVENAMVLKAFRVLYVNARPSVVDFISQMVSITLHVLFNGQFDDCESHVSAITFMLEIQSEYPDHFNEH
ncbi:importin-4-like [Drosophila subobscura]|uniref:importin-4-like n=1 Tax=Drosophila subobscura TaxID=7241 RepID=UPI00155A7AFF|nr:importin-4-like [Drosophila subobscura]